jgi:hypothetical protein
MWRCSGFKRLNNLLMFGICIAEYICGDPESTMAMVNGLRIIPIQNSLKADECLQKDVKSRLKTMIRAKKGEATLVGPGSITGIEQRLTVLKHRVFRAVCMQAWKTAVARPSPLRYSTSGLRMLGRWAFSGESRGRPFEFQGKTFQPLTLPPL